MTSGTPAHWYSAAELAALGLPGLPATARSLLRRATQDGWHARCTPDGQPLARKRGGKSGGYEFHVRALPNDARLALEARFPGLAAANDEMQPDPHWAVFSTLPDRVKQRAQHRLMLVQAVERHIAEGYTKTSAIALASMRHGDSRRAIFGYLAQVAGVPVCDRLPYLAPRSGGGRAQAALDPEAWRVVTSDYLRPEKPSWEACYRRMVDGYAAPRGLTVPSSKALLRRFEKEVPRNVVKRKRGGREDLRLTVPPLKRTVAGLHAMYAVNVDGHTFDVFVNWGKDASGKDIIARPVMVGIQDIYSRKLLAYRIGETENTALTRFAFGDLFRDFGVPEKAILDNGRAFASKAMTGGQKTRFRGKIKDSDYNGLLTQLGVDTGWTLPARGSSKPIERAWRDLCEDVAKHPAMSGAYTGGKPDAKPDNYQTRAVPIDEFRVHVATCIARHNARIGRRTEMANGRSFDQVFAESYATAIIRRVPEATLQLALLEAKDCRVHPANNVISLYGNQYWTPDLEAFGGQRVMVRFDPDNLHSQIHVFAKDGRFLCIAPVIGMTGFFDKSGAKRRGKLESDVRKTARAHESKLNLLAADELAALYAGGEPDAPTAAPKVVRAVRHRGQTAAALKPQFNAVEQAAQPEFTSSFDAGLKRHLRVVE